MSDAPMFFDMPPSTAGFDARGAWYLKRLMADLSLAMPEQAAGIVGAAGAESGLEAIQEHHPIAGRGGFGWHQWTGPRRIAFEKFCADHDMNTTDDQANYLYLLDELHGSEAAALDEIRKATTVERAVYAFVVQFERPANPNADAARGIPYARRAMAAAGFGAAPQLPVITQPLPISQPIQIIPPLPSSHPPFNMPPSFNSAATGAAGVVAFAFVATVIWLLGMKGIIVPDFLQNAWLAALIYVGTWFVHTRLAKALLLNQQK